MSGSNFPILMTNGLAVTAPNGGGVGRLTLAPFDANNPQQQFKKARNHIVPAQNPNNAIEIQAAPNANQAVAGDPVEIKSKNLNSSFQAWVFENGILEPYEFEGLALGLGSLALVSKAPTAPQPGRTAAVTIQNESGGTVYISYEVVHHGEPQTIQVPIGSTLRAISTQGHVLETRNIAGDQTIKLTQNLALTATNKTEEKVELKPQVAGPSGAFIEKDATTTITAPNGTIYDAFDPNGKKLLFRDKITGQPEVEILVDEVVENYDVVSPSSNTFFNRTGALVYLTATHYPRATINKDGKYDSNNVIPGTTYRASDASGTPMTITSTTNPSLTGTSVTVEKSDVFNITAIPPVPPGPKFNVALHNKTTAEITVSVEGTQQAHKVARESTSPSITLPKDAVLLAVSSRPGTIISPAKKTVSKDETIVFTAGLILDGEFSDIIHEWLPDREFTLIYQAERPDRRGDGFLASDFHRECDNRGATLTVITTTEDYVFGGYTPDSWVSNGTWYNNAAAFLFTLRNQHGKSMRRYPNSGSYSTHGGARYGPFFGSDAIHVSADPRASRSSGVAATFPQYPTGASNVFSNVVDFIPRNIEVYRVTYK